MALRESPFSSPLLEWLHAAAWALVLPCFWFLDRLLALCHSTTLERAHRAEMECYLHPLKVVFGTLLFFILFMIAAPVALLGFLFWAPLQGVRRPFCYRRRRAGVVDGGPHAAWLQQGGRATFTFAAANLCLLPDGLARFNNLGHTQLRAGAVGQRIVQGVSRPHIRIMVDSPSSCGTLSPSNSLLAHVVPSAYGAVDVRPQSPQGALFKDGSLGGFIPRSECEDVAVETENTDGPRFPARALVPTSNSNQNATWHGSRGQRGTGQGPHAQGDNMLWEVSSLFPADVDVVCLLEVFDKRAAEKLREALSPVFGHVLYDVGVYAFQAPGCCSFKFFNSGILLASRYPVLEAQYHCFPNGQGEDALAAKGLLSAKVLIGQNQKQKNVVGYFNCTHLHAPEGDGEVRCEQLSMIVKWIGEFQAKTKQDDDLVVFDIICGDLNFDNCSPDDFLEQKHGVFEEYRDPCRDGPGKEKPWVIGTLLEQPTLYHEDVRTPESLQRTLEQEELRKQYIAPPMPLGGRPLVYPESGCPWVGRRIDYIMYRESTLAKHCHTEVEEFTFVTQLAGLTDHIPVGLRLNVTLGSDPADL